MISFINREELDVVKYNHCIEKSLQSRVFGYSWYLDIACDTWGALILDDYQAVMPIPWNKKYTIKYVYPPLWVLELGVFSLEKIETKPFLESLLRCFKFVELRLNTDNGIEKINDQSVIRKMQWISIAEGYDDVFLRYRKDRKKDLVKANKFGLREVWQDTSENLVTLFKNNIGKRDQNIEEKDYQNLSSLIEKCIRQKVGEVLSIYDENECLVASAFFLLYNKTATILVSSTDLRNRKNGANTFLIDRAISKYQETYTSFNFGGSSIQTVADYFKSFGANESNYSFLKQNKLPVLIKLFRK
ncbi:hypothetical protein RQM59_13930 [Flavobacteriaceae bacterium S356]|uniref:BioF2-like acetyltransferase domain-containing protein n=1 Tax=Asprobacillus argus TaxID=3076534 RepID=A0ABU3LIC8_9FLAO|nr:hypothetical protein [Flavobacteriaceae bacterium S356]